MTDSSSSIDFSDSMLTYPIIRLPDRVIIPQAEIDDITCIVVFIDLGHLTTKTITVSPSELVNLYKISGSEPPRSLVKQLT